MKRMIPNDRKIFWVVQYVYPSISQWKSDLRKQKKCLKWAGVVFTERDMWRKWGKNPTGNAYS